MKRRKRTTKTLKDLLQQRKRELKKKLKKFYKSAERLGRTATQKSIGTVLILYYIGFLGYLWLELLEKKNPVIK